MKLKAPWNFNDVCEAFPRGRKVCVIDRPSSEGLVNYIDRSPYSDCGVVMVEWSATGVVAQVHPSQIRLMN